MEDKLFAFLNKLFTGSFGLFDQLITGIPIAEDAIMWAFFIYLAFNLIVLPLRGCGASDLASAKAARRGKRSSRQNSAAAD